MTPLSPSDQLVASSNAMTHLHHAASVHEFKSVGEECHSRMPKFFGYFYGNEDPVTNRSWCPDCVIAEPVVKEAFKHAPEGTQVIRTAVGTRDDWKNPENEWRKELKLKCIPTLIKFIDGKEIDRLEDLDCASPEKLSEFLQDC